MGFPPAALTPALTSLLHMKAAAFSSISSRELGEFLGVIARVAQKTVGPGKPRPELVSKEHEHNRCSSCTPTWTWVSLLTGGIPMLGSVRSSHYDDPGCTAIRIERNTDHRKRRLMSIPHVRSAQRSRNDEDISSLKVQCGGPQGPRLSPSKRHDRSEIGPPGSKVRKVALQVPVQASLVSTCFCCGCRTGWWCLTACFCAESVPKPGHRHTALVVAAFIVESNEHTEPTATVNKRNGTVRPTRSC